MGLARAALITVVDDPPVAAEVRRRAAEPTVPGGGATGDAFDTVADFPERALASGPGSAGGDASGGRSSTRRFLRELWCVDLGPAIQTMSTYELWLAIAGGAVARRSAVWREGMECWTSIEDVPELACALIDGAEARPGDDAPLASSARSPEPPATSPAPPPSRTNDASGARAIARSGRPRGGLGWITAGSAVAFVAVGLALVVSEPPPPPPAVLGAPSPWAELAASAARRGEASAAIPTPEGAVAGVAPACEGRSPTRAASRLHADPGPRRARARTP
jgi:hypothetical protein